MCWSIAVTAILAGCTDTGHRLSDSARGSPARAAVDNTAPGTGWDADAGRLMIVSLDATSDSVAVVLPEITDSTIESVQDIDAPVANLSFDLFGRSGRIASNITVSPVAIQDSSQECYSWPLAKLRTQKPGWNAGFVAGHADAIKLDSIEAMTSADSAELVRAIAQGASTQPVATDPTFRGLPFRVRSAYAFRVDSTDVIVANVVRAVNEEANPRIEYLLIVGERARDAVGKLNVEYFDRAAGAEGSTQASELLAAVRVGLSKRPVLLVSAAYEDGAKLGLIARSAGGKWTAIWRSAYTNC